MYYIGIDLGGTNIKAGIIRADGSIVRTRSVETGVKYGFSEVVKRIGGLAAKLIAEAGVPLSECAGVGIGSPGTVDSAGGKIVYANNLFWEDADLRGELSKYINLPIYMSNDANAAALGEYLFGAGRGSGNMLMFTLGTGVGGGVIIDGKLYEGNKSAGAELGHIKIASKGRSCTCGRKDCFETYASATALIGDTKTAMLKNRDSAMWQYTGGDPEKADGKTAFECAKAGDKAAERVIRSYIKNLADGVTSFVNIFMPETIVLGGGVCAQGAALLVPLRKHVKKYQYGGKRSPKVNIVVAELGNNAGIVGAASLAMNK
ncbi:MAG: ROK family protein [Firmicutes bacterium]|nr:ROK family protein [Bacillota bacterium]